MILAIDPGPEQSALVKINLGAVVDHGIFRNETIRHGFGFHTEFAYDRVAVEMVACYGMAVGKEVFETCLWIGRFIERSPIEPILVYRREVKMHFCHSMQAKDANIRQAIIDRYGGKEKAIGKKATPGPLYGIKSHCWSALSIALFVADTK